MPGEDDEVVQLIMGRVVNVTQWDAERQRVFASAMADFPPDSPEGIAFREMMKPYPGSVIKQCQFCQVEIWVGPRQQQVYEQMRLHGVSIGLCCAVCAPMAAAKNPQADIAITNLGNDWHPAE